MDQAVLVRVLQADRVWPTTRRRRPRAAATASTDFRQVQAVDVLHHQDRVPAISRAS